MRASSCLDDEDDMVLARSAKQRAAKLFDAVDTTISVRQKTVSHGYVYLANKVCLKIKYFGKKIKR